MTYLASATTAQNRPASVSDGFEFLVSIYDVFALNWFPVAATTFNGSLNVTRNDTV